MELTSLAEWRTDSVLCQWRTDLALCQCRIDSDIFQHGTDSDHSGTKKIKKIRKIEIAHTHARLEADLLDVDLHSSSIVTNANESSTQAPALIDITLYICVS